MFPTPLWLPHQKIKASEKRKRNKSTQARRTTMPSQAKRKQSQPETPPSLLFLHLQYIFFLEQKRRFTRVILTWRFSLPRVSFLAHASFPTHRYFPRATPSVDSSPPTKRDPPKKHHSPAPKGSQIDTTEGFHLARFLQTTKGSYQSRARLQLDEYVYVSLFPTP